MPERKRLFESNMSSLKFRKKVRAGFVTRLLAFGFLVVGGPGHCEGLCLPPASNGSTLGAPAASPDGRKYLPTLPGVVCGAELSPAEKHCSCGHSFRTTPTLQEEPPALTGVFFDFIFREETLA